MPIAINIKGAAGSGKSTLVERLFSFYNKEVPIFEDSSRRYPLYYDLGDNLRILGSYESHFAGCDTIKQHHKVEKLVKAGLKEGRHVIWESYWWSWETERTLWLTYPDGLIVFLLPGVETCRLSVLERHFRAHNTLRGKGSRYIAEGYKKVEKCYQKIKQVKRVKAFSDRDDAFKCVWNHLVQSNLE